MAADPTLLTTAEIQEIRRTLAIHPIKLAALCTHALTVSEQLAAASDYIAELEARIAPAVRSRSAKAANFA